MWLEQRIAFSRCYNCSVVYAEVSCHTIIRGTLKHLYLSTLIQCVLLIRMETAGASRTHVRNVARNVTTDSTTWRRGTISVALDVNAMQEDR